MCDQQHPVIGPFGACLRAQVGRVVFEVFLGVERVFFEEKLRPIFIFLIQRAPA